MKKISLRFYPIFVLPYSCSQSGVRKNVLACMATPLSEPERQLLVLYSTKANAFCGLHGSFFPIFFLPNSQKAFAFVEYGTRSCLSGSDGGVVAVVVPKLFRGLNRKEKRRNNIFGSPSTFHFHQKREKRHKDFVLGPGDFCSYLQFGQEVLFKSITGLVRDMKKMKTRFTLLFL